MFGLSKRRMKIGRLKVQLSDSAQGTKSPIRQPKRSSNSSSEAAAAENTTPDEVSCQLSAAAADPDNSASINYENWSLLPIFGGMPAPRYNHAATVIGNKMVVVGGESANGLLEDVQVLDFDRFTWTTASSKLYLSPSSLPLKIPACKGHSLISWGQKVLLIGGKMNCGSDRLSVWVLDTETECWSLMEAKGDIPVARSGHTVARASSVLIIFGGEDDKGKKLNDLHMFDLKSLTWLPLHCTGTGPSPRTNHVSALFDDRMLLIFGGTSKSKTLNDLYSLDFETMVWSRMKTKGFLPAPRAGCCGILSGSKWYIVGGGSKKKRHAETLVLDVLNPEWTVAIESPTSSITSNKGFSLVLVQQKRKDLLVAFGGYKKEPSNQVEVLIIEKNELPTTGKQSTPTKGPEILLPENHLPSTGLASPLIIDTRQNNMCARQNLASAIEHGSGRKSLSETLLVDPNHVSGNGSIHKQFHNEEEHDIAIKTTRNLKDLTSSLQATESGTKQLSSALQTQITGGKMSIEELPNTFESENLKMAHSLAYGHIAPENDDVVVPEADINSGVLSAPSSIYQFYEGKVTALIRKNGILEGQLAAALSNREAAEKNLSSALKSRQEMEKKFAATVKEMELLKEKLSATELAREESNSLSNIVHSDNVRLEHDVAFLRAILDDTQKELHSTRGVLAGERARAFQLQVEVFHLKQRIQNLENRAPTPRKPFQM